MKASKTALIVINVLGGIAVIGSYIYGLMTHPGQGNDLWGGVPEAIRGVYGLSMLFAAAGYLLFFYQIVVRLDASKAKLPWDLPYSAFHVLFIAILLPSSLWMSLTFAWLAESTTANWVAVRAVLFAVGLASTALLVVLAGLRSRAPDQHWWPGTIGAAVFTFHTLGLDAILWPILFRS